MHDALNELEKTALKKALEGSALWLETLRGQLPHLRVKARMYTRAGGYTDLVVDSAVEPASIPQGDRDYPSVTVVHHPLLVHGGAFIVWTKDGVINLLEANADGDGVWPVGREAHLEEFTFSKPEVARR